MDTAIEHPDVEEVKQAVGLPHATGTSDEQVTPPPTGKGIVDPTWCV